MNYFNIPITWHNGFFCTEARLESLKYVRSRYVSASNPLVALHGLQNRIHISYHDIRDPPWPGSWWPFWPYFLLFSPSLTQPVTRGFCFSLGMPSSFLTQDLYMCQLFHLELKFYTPPLFRPQNSSLKTQSKTIPPFSFRTHFSF